MFTEPEITTSKNLKLRFYISFYFNGVRRREYNGKAINKAIHPNKAHSIEERNKLLVRLQFEFLIALENDTYSTEKIKPQEKLPVIKANAKTLMKEVLNRKLTPDLSVTYKYNRQNQEVLSKHIINQLTIEKLKNGTNC